MGTVSYLIKCNLNFLLCNLLAKSNNRFSTSNHTSNIKKRQILSSIQSTSIVPKL